MVPEAASARNGEQAADLPLVAVVIPCHGHAHFLPDAIESVLAQTHPRMDVIVVDDGSPDDTAEVASSYDRVRLIRQQCQGLSAARNTGLAAASADFVLFLDADDRLRPGAVEAGLAAFAERPEAAFVTGKHIRVDVEGAPIAEPGTDLGGNDAYLAFLRGNPVGMHAAVLYRREAVERAGGFDRSLPACEDYDLYLRITRRFPVHAHDAVVAEYRRHGGNMSNDPAFMLREALAVLHRQWPHVTGDPARLAAYYAGVCNWTTYYLREMSDGAGSDPGVLPAARPARQRSPRSGRRATWRRTADRMARRSTWLSGRLRRPRAPSGGSGDPLKS